MMRGWRVGLLLLAIAILARAQTFGSPTIEFDEQFYLLVGDRVLGGAIPYIDIWDRKPIGLFLIFAAIRTLGGDGFLAYQIVATLFVVGTAWFIHAFARRGGTGDFGAICAGAGYVLWLNLLQGEGGQASVFYTLPVVAAAWLTVKATTKPRALVALGCGAMILVGLAIQIKYTAVLEGVLFGVWLLWAGLRQRQRPGRLALAATLWIGLALLPTAAAIGAYAAMGHFDAFIFANFLSLAARAAPPLGAVLGDLATGLGILLLPLMAAAIGWRQLDDIVKPFILSWGVVAAIAIGSVGTFSPHYFITLLPAIMIAAAPACDQLRKLAIALILIAAIAGQGLLAFYDFAKGGRDEAEAMVRAIGPVPHCLYVHNGFPSLYMLTNSCLPTRFIFPGHLNTAVEAKAIGVNPVEELARILAKRPDAIVTDLPVFSQGNKEVQAALEVALARDYTLALRLKTGKSRYRLVYRIKPSPAASDN